MLAHPGRRRDRPRSSSCPAPHPRPPSRRPNRPDILQAPVAIALDERGQAYIIDDELNHVTILDATGEMTGSLGEPGPGQFDQPAGIVVTDDAVWVVDQGNGRVRRFTRTGVFVTAFGSPGDGPAQFDTGRHRIQTHTMRTQHPGRVVSIAQGEVVSLPSGAREASG